MIEHDLDLLADKMSERMAKRCPNGVTEQQAHNLKTFADSLGDAGMQNWFRVLQLGERMDKISVAGWVIVFVTILGGILTLVWKGFTGELK